MQLIKQTGKIGRIFNHRLQLSILKDSTAAEYLMYVMEITEIFEICVALWGTLLSDWIKEVEIMIEQKAYRQLDSISSLLKGDVRIMTFNYTKTVQVLYGKYGVKHIHNRVGQELVFGHSKSNAINQEDCYNSLNSNYLDDILKMLYKDTDRQLSKYKNFFKKN